jgi:hypothetical protein
MGEFSQGDLTIRASARSNKTWPSMISMRATLQPWASSELLLLGSEP